MVGQSHDELLDGLDLFLRTGEGATTRPRTRAPRIAFVFPGQGSQWIGMGRELLSSDAVFRESMTRCDAVVREMEGWSILEEIARDAETSRLREVDIDAVHVKCGQRF
ncbi:MAG: hypothetical protein NVS3B20_22740 [Polyangiales bacterium]